MSLLTDYTEKLKKERNFDRILFLIGCVITFVGFLLPSFKIEGEGTFNVISGASAFNVSGTAYLATFIVAMWLCSIAGIVTFLSSKSIAADIFVWLIGAGFGIADLIAMTAEYGSPFTYMHIGAYIVFIGWTLALVAAVLEGMHIQPTARN